MPEGQSFRETLEADIFDGALPTSDIDNKKTNVVMYYMYELGDGVAYTDSTGKFPYRSTRGNNYIMVAYNYDVNAILAEQVKNRQAATLLEAWTIINNKFVNVGVRPNTYVMDNEISNDLKPAIQKAGVKY